MPGSDRQTHSPFSASPLIEVQDISRNFGTLTAVDGASFSVRSGTICGVIGSDGAGKTTLLRIVATMIKPSRGRVLLQGLDVVRQRSEAKNLMGYMPQRFGLYPDLTVGENLNFFMDIFGIFGKERKKRSDEYLGFSNLIPFVDRLARDLSGGMKRRLVIARALLNQPRLLILDEPSLGLGPLIVENLFKVLHDINTRGVTILLVEQNAVMALEYADRAYVLENGRVTLSGPSRELADNQQVRRAYLGGV